MLMVSAISVPIAGAAGNTYISFLNPLADVEPQYNMPLAPRLDTFEGKTIAVASYSKAGNVEAGTSLGRMLEAEYGVLSEENPAGVRVLYGGQVYDGATYPNLGSPWNPKSDVNYNLWAQADAVIFGVAD
jgi:hypothetical protein